MGSFSFRTCKKVEEASEAGQGRRATNTMAHERHTVYRPDGHRKQKPEWRSEGDKKRPRRDVRKMRKLDGKVNWGR